MRLEATDDQAALVDHFDRLFARDWQDDDWGDLMATGLPLMRVDPAHGGSGLSLQEAALILERAGWHEVPHRLIGTVPTARLLSLSGNHDQLELIMSGGRVGQSFSDIDPALQSAAEVERRLLTVAYLCGLTRRALADAAAYASERMAFGKPIGAFQGVSHPLADAVVDIDGGWLLVLRAISAMAEGAEAAITLVDAADWWVRNQSQPALLHALRVYGGHGVAIGQPAARRYLVGRVIALGDGPPDVVLDRYGASVAGLPDAIGEPFDFGAALSGHADRTHQFFKERLTPELKAFAAESEDGHNPAIQCAMAAEDLLFPHWGGKVDGYALAEIRLASARAGWNLTAIAVTDLVGAILAQFGSDFAREVVIPRLADGTANCALGYTEPAGGSDVFAAETRADRDGTGWRIKGQKIFTSQGHLADYVLVIARTDRTAAKHRGITLFLVPTDAPGYSFTALQTLGGERTNTTYYDDVLISDDYRVGPVDGGAAVLVAALELEQNCGHHFLPPIERMVAAARAWQEAECPANQPLKRAIASAEIQGNVLDLLSRRALWSQVEHKALPAAGPAAKLFGSEACMRIGHQLLSLTAPASLRGSDHPLAVIEREARRAIASTIYGGTSEIQRSLIAEGRLGLPRSRL